MDKGHSKSTLNLVSRFDVSKSRFYKAKYILLSKKVRDEVKNNPDLQLQSLGSFEFKNVDEPLEVFALANDGLVIPKRSEMKGKIKTTKKNKTTFEKLQKKKKKKIFFVKD